MAGARPSPKWVKPVLSSRRVIEAAENIVRKIVDTYAAPKKTKRSRRFLGVGSRRRDLTPGCRLRLGAPLLRCGALRVPGFYGKGRHRLGSVGSRRRN